MNDNFHTRPRMDATRATGGRVGRGVHGQGVWGMVTIPGRIIIGPCDANEQAAEALRKVRAGESVIVNRYDVFERIACIVADDDPITLVREDAAGQVVYDVETLKSAIRANFEIRPVTRWLETGRVEE